ncbi:linear amide C-N hydrolase [Chachezhania antarctica]|uniref:linear amide C-N hydrolase n=1 Tax=Chachezhania antarctica TaxID=2340860 RepID=UPI000EB0207C|nr:choloylglycine hydrolase family protein [Chachezhania antarctica]|tara:strand:- start:6214 stop:7308 length:1095 start_codon:yes stop_codon:yes gene_type:complete
MPLIPILKRVAATTAALAIATQSALACTGIILQTEDGATVFGRTMEFGYALDSELYAVPAGTKIETLALNPDESGFGYTTKYGIVGLNGLKKPIIVDGMNTEGLHFGAFYFAGEAWFPAVTAETQDTALSAEEVGNWVLGNFATVAELREALPSVTLVGTPIEGIGDFAPLHFSVVDATGASIVIEQTKSGLTVHDNTVNAITNNPTFDWHLTNLRAYIGLTEWNRGAVKVGEQTLEPYGQGTGFAGLPGDGSSPSRFVRAVAYANSAEPMKDTDEAIFRTFHILNNFDIPVGSVREKDNGKVEMEYSLWTTAADTKNVVFYYKTYEAQQVVKIDVKKALDGLSAPAKKPLDTTFSVVDRTDGF